MRSAFLSPSNDGGVQRPSSAQGRLESGASTHRTQPQHKPRQPATFLTYHNQRTCQTSRTTHPASPSTSTRPSTSHRHDDDSPPAASWSQRLLSNAQHISPSVAQHYALPTATTPSTHHTTTRRASTATDGPTTPALANLAARHLPASPYLRQHLSMLAQQLGGELTAQHLTQREDDDAVQRTVRRAVRHEMRQQTTQRAAEEQKEETEAEQRGAPPVYPFTAHAAALRQHVLTLSSLQTRFDTLVQSISRSSSMHGLLASFSASYLALFSSLLSTLFSLNHHYHFTLHHASFTLSSQQAEHVASLANLQQRLRLMSSANQSSQALARIELQQRQHGAQHVQHLHAILRQQAADIQHQAQHTADQIESTTSSSSGGVGRDAMLELSAETFMQSHQLSLLLNALCYEAEEEAAQRVKLDTLMVEGRRSAKDMWQNTLSKKKEDAAAKVKDRKERERQTMLAAAQGSSAAPTPRGWTAGPYNANGFSLLPVLSRFMRGMQTLMSPQRNAPSSLESVNSQLINILMTLPSAVGVDDFPTHLLSVIMTAQTSPQAAQRHLRSLFTHCTANYQHPLPRLILPLIATYTGRAAQSVFSSGLTPRAILHAAAASTADSTPPPALAPPSSFTLHVVAECLRFLAPLVAAARDKELLFAVALLQVQVPALLTAFFAPASDDAVRVQLLAWLDAQSLLGTASLAELVLLFAAAYRSWLVEWVRQRLGGAGQLGWDEVLALMQAMCGSETRWQIAGKGEVAKVYVEWSARCGEIAASASGEDVDEVSVLLDVLSLRRWMMSDGQTIP